MKRVLIVLLLASVCAAGQSTTTKDSKPAKMEQKASGAAVSATRLQAVWDAWCTLDASKAAKYYDQAAEDVFFDLEPLQYHGWAEYQKGAQALLDTMKSAKCKVDEVKIHAGPATWTTAIVHLTMEMKQGGTSSMDARWTSVWEKRGSDWKIVHEHISVPMK